MNIKTLTTLEYHQIIEEIKTFALLDHAKERIGQLEPYTDHVRITQLLNETTEAVAVLKNSSSIPLLGINGFPFLFDKVKKGLILQPDELEKVLHLLHLTKKIKTFMTEHQIYAPTISGYCHSMYDLNEVKEEITRCIQGGRVSDKASSTLAKVRKQMYILEGRIRSKLDAMTKSSGIAKYLQDNSVTIKNNHFVLQVKSAYKHEISGTVIDTSSTGSTLFVEPAAITALQGELNLAILEEEREIYQILSYLTAVISENMQTLELTLEAFTNYDMIFAKGKYSRSIDASSVDINTSQQIHIINGKHPLLPKDAVPLDFVIGSDYRAVVITGPNTGGKTVALKTVGLLTLMVQSGLHIPANPKSSIGIFSNVLTDIGDGQSITQSLSTFSSHIRNIIDILAVANRYSLVLLDEIGSGTDPTEGEGLAISILESLYSKGATVIASSHYGKVKEYASVTPGFINGRMHFDIDTLKPTYQLTLGEAGESNAFIISLRLGLSPDILNRAHQLTYNENLDYSILQKQAIPKAHQPSYVKGKRPMPIKQDIASLTTSKEQTNQCQKEAVPEHVFQIGDQVIIRSLNAKGIVFESENTKQEVGILVHGKKMYIHKRKVKLFIASADLYPENYNFDIVFKSKEYRKADHLMNRKYVKGVEFEVKESDL